MQLLQLKYVPWGLIDNKPSLVQLMAWFRTGDKPLSEPMIPTLLDLDEFYFTGMAAWRQS